MARVADSQREAADEAAEVLNNLHVDDVHSLQDKDPEPDAHGQGGYRFDTAEHQQQLREQRTQLWNWLKGVGAHMFKEGINLTKISLPVCLFEPRSFLERLTTNWEYNSLLVAAAGCADPADRLRYVVAFAVSGLCRQVSFHKPFNPILGETYQAVYPNGIEVYCEQISHHPPISSWQVYEPEGKFVFYGNGNWVAGIKGNSVKGRQTGTNCVTFASDGASVEYELPGLQVKGVLWGTRVLKYSGQMVFKDVKNGLTATIDVDPQPQTGFLTGWFRAKKAPHKPDQVRAIGVDPTPQPPQQQQQQQREQQPHPLSGNRRAEVTEVSNVMEAEAAGGPGPEPEPGRLGSGGEGAGREGGEEEAAEAAEVVGGAGTGGVDARGAMAGDGGDGGDDAAETGRAGVDGVDGGGGGAVVEGQASGGSVDVVEAGTEAAAAGAAAGAGVASAGVANAGGAVGGSGQPAADGGGRGGGAAGVAGLLARAATDWVAGSHWFGGGGGSGAAVGGADTGSQTLIVGKLCRGDTVIDTCHGNWLHYFEWDKGANGGRAKRLWDIRTSTVTPAVPVSDPLPSDCRNREDVVFLKAKDQPKSQEWKLTLEERQRRDRKLRKEGGGVNEH
ncbi:hypothetical protein HYH02_001141 [Chlamydomonas schloesseri]|uniref:Oxysterol-binding protein n=1 Tax=Chlamydomonas schloesseri TaxID=2026947 RepID=A0A836BC38_9CHLO|nr:hypothetical protein HYH02_001141 [Chlamydomonas schloesseri]|eukprot:KAG2454102.1 hypothetical protein HYH02_001141 [Chlamydomonas schloesseri]